MIVEPSSLSRMNHGDVRAGAIQVQRRFRGRIFAANDDDISPPKRMRLGVVVRNVRQIFAGNAEAIGQVVVAGCDGNLLGGELRRDSLLIPRVHDKMPVAALDALDAMAQAQIQVVVLDALAVILQGLGARGFLGGAGQRQVADLQQFRRREKDHVHRIVVEGIAEAALVDHQRPHAGAFGFDGAGQAGGAGADANQIVGAHEKSLPWDKIFCNSPARVHPGLMRL